MIFHFVKHLTLVKTLVLTCAVVGSYDTVTAIELSLVRAQENDHAKVCKVVSKGGDDHDVIVAALKECGHGGELRFSAGNTYTLKSPIKADQYPALSDTTITIEGTINHAYGSVGKDDTDTIYWEIHGSNVHIQGSGVINGHGQQWWNAGNRGPKIMELDVKTGSLSGVTFKNGPSHMLLVGGSDFKIKNVKIHSISDDYKNAYPSNTDGMNIRGKRIVVQDTDIIAGDDCISFIDGADTSHINNVKCGGPTHGISVGTLGSEDLDKKKVGVVTNVLVENVKFYDGGLAAKWSDYFAPQFIARIKTYGGSGSTGRVENVTWQHITSPNGISPTGKTAVYITQNHDTHEEQEPAESGIKINDIKFIDISGGKIPKADQYGSVSITCSAAHHCDNILIKNIVFTGAHSAENHCLNAIGLHKNCEDCGGNC